MRREARGETVEVVDEGGGPPCFTLTLSAYWELLGATEKYISLLNETAPGYLSAANVRCIDRIELGDGIWLTPPGRPEVPVTVTITRVGIQMGMEKVPFVDITRIDEHDSLTIVVGSATYTLRCTSPLTHETIVKIITLRRDAVAITPQPTQADRPVPPRRESPVGDIGVGQLRPHHPPDKMHRSPPLPPPDPPLRRTSTPSGDTSRPPPKPSQPQPVPPSPPVASNRAVDGPSPTRQHTPQPIRAPDPAPPPDELIPLTRNISTAEELEGLSMHLTNMSPCSQPFRMEVVASCGQATVVPIGDTVADLTADAVTLTAVIPMSSPYAMCGFDPRPNRATGQSLRIIWHDDNARAVVGWRNTAPHRVTVHGSFAPLADSIAVIPLGTTKQEGRAEYSSTVLPGDVVEFVQITSTGRTAGKVVGTVSLVFGRLTPQQQQAYLVPFALSPAEPPNFSLQKLVAEYGFDEAATNNYCARRLDHEVSLARSGSRDAPYVDLEFLPHMKAIGVLKRPQQFLAIHRHPVEMVRDSPCKAIEAPPGHWVVGALRAMALCPSLIKGCFAEYDLPAGCYTVRICKDGWWVDVTTDTWIPCDGSGPSYARARSGELWVPLLEKAVAKVVGGYPALTSASSAPCAGKALSMLTGAAFHSVELAQHPEELKSWGEASLMVAEGAAQPPAAILNVVGGMVRLFGGSPAASWGWDDPRWQRPAEEELYAACPPGSTPEGDREEGVYWMAIPDFTARYTSLTIVHTRPGWGDLRVFADSMDFVVELAVERETRAVVQLLPSSSASSTLLGLAVLRAHPDPHIAYEPIALVPAAGGASYGDPLAVELTFMADTTYVLVPSPVRGKWNSSFILCIQTEVPDAGWGYLRRVTPTQVGEMFFAPLCRQGRGQDAKPLPTGRHGATSVWWREDTDLPLGMVLENTSGTWVWRCEARTDGGAVASLTLPPNSKRHIFPDMALPQALHYDHYVTIYHTSSYHEEAGRSQEGKPLFTYASSITRLPTVERPVQKDGSSQVHMWHTIRL